MALPSLPFTLFDRPRRLRFDLNALADFEQEFGVQGEDEGGDEGEG